MDLLGSIMGSMDKPPTPSEREKKMQKVLQAKTDKRLETEQKKRAKFRREAEQKMKNFMGEDEEKELSFPKLVKVYRAILHDVADAAGLYSHSVGEGDEKDLIITKVPANAEVPDRKILSPTKDCSLLTSGHATPPSGDYRQKYQHLIGGLACAEETAVRMEPNRAFGYVPSANKRDHRSIEETMNDLRTRKKPKLDPSLSLSELSPSCTSPLSSHDITQSPDTVDHTP